MIKSQGFEQCPMNSNTIAIYVHIKMLATQFFLKSIAAISSIVKELR